MFDEKIRGEILYNAGGVLNHELYFSNLNPNGKREPSGLLLDAINKKYDSFSNFVLEFINTANKLKGSGFTFLVINNNDLEIINLPNQENPRLPRRPPRRRHSLRAPGLRGRGRSRRLGRCHQPRWLPQSRRE